MAREDLQASCCEGKQAFDRKTANRVARETTKIKLDVYRCRFCGHYHVGKVRSGPVPRKRRRGEYE